MGIYGNIAKARAQAAQRAADPWSRTGMQRRLQDIGDDQLRRGQRATGAYENFAENFDPRTAIREYAQGLWNDTEEGMNRNLESLRGQSEGMGRSNSGFLDRDSGQVVRDTRKDFGNTLARTAVDAAGMKADIMTGYGNYGRDSENTGYDIITARRQQEEDRRRERQASRGGGIGGMLGQGLGMLAGSVLPGVGTAIGGYFGKKLFPPMKTGV